MRLITVDANTYLKHEQFAVFALFAVVIAIATAFPQGYDAPAYPAADYKPGYANGRVKIQTYRGPNKEYGKGDGYGKSYDDGAFAPWGFYVNQPEDNKAYYGKY